MHGVSVNFTAIDFETANGSGASACSVGLVKVRDGRVVDRAYWLLRPPFPHDEFMEWNVRIHGITREMVADAPSWGDQLAAFREFAEDDWLVAHNAGFDMGVIAKTCAATRRRSCGRSITSSFRPSTCAPSSRACRAPLSCFIAGRRSVCLW